MRSYIFVTFAFLAFAFYELSGGGDYEPAPNSIQARAADKAGQAESVDMATLDGADTLVEVEVETVTRASSSLSDLKAGEDAQGERFQITLASVEQSDPSAQESSLPKVTVETAKSETVADAVAIDAAVQEAAAQPDITSEIQPVTPREVFSLETYAASQGTDAQVFGVSSATPGDIREVAGDQVNMRAGPGTDYQRVGSLTKGMEVIVLDEPGNGWIMLEVVETGETGWMADWLVTASN
jgi:hypothetical protein